VVNRIRYQEDGYGFERVRLTPTVAAPPSATIAITGVTSQMRGNTPWTVALIAFSIFQFSSREYCAERPKVILRKLVPLCTSGRPNAGQYFGVRSYEVKRSHHEIGPHLPQTPYYILVPALSY
jgi:hypothetical protein